MSANINGRKNEEIEEFYNVEEILDKKRVGRTHHYLVKWEGYSKKYSTWEPKRHLLRVRHIVLDFEKKFKIQNSNKQCVDDQLKIEQTSKNSKKRLKKTRKRVRVINNDNSSKFEKLKTEEIEENNFSEKKECNPERILSAYLNKENNIQFIVEYPNYQKKNVSHTAMRKFYPDILCDFYESKIRILKTKNNEINC